MAVIRRQNFLGQQRVDTPHLKSVESAISNDFDQLISGLVIGQDKSYVVRGFRINMPGSIGSSANGLQLIVENSAFLHGASNESGTFYTIPQGTPAEILNSTTNERIEGAFTPNTDNYVGIEFVREVDDSTTDQVYFWNPTTNVEITKTVPLAIILDYKIVIRTSSFESNVLPVAIVRTDDSNNVVSITDRRPLLYRLGTAGANEPNPFYEYDWSETRNETFYTSSSSSSDPFYGGDKVIGNMKDFFDALMTEFKLLKGTPYWYSESSAGSLYRNRQDLGSTALTGKGTVSHGVAFFEGQVAGMTSDVVLKGISTEVILEASGLSETASFTGQINDVGSVQLLTVNIEADNPGTAGNIILPGVTTTAATTTFSLEGVQFDAEDQTGYFFGNNYYEFINGYIITINQTTGADSNQTYVEVDGGFGSDIIISITYDTNNTYTLTVQDIISILQGTGPLSPNITFSDNRPGSPLNISNITGNVSNILDPFVGYSSNPFSGGSNSNLEVAVNKWNIENPTNTITVVSVEDQFSNPLSADQVLYDASYATLTGGVDGSTKTIDNLILEWNLANNEEPVFLVSGDGSQIPTANIEMTSDPGRINWDSDMYLNFIGGNLRYKIKSNKYTDHIVLTDDQVAYLNLVRGVNILPNLIFTTGGKTVTAVGKVNWTEDLEPGDFIKDASRGDEYYYEIETVDNLYQVTLKEEFEELSSGDAGFDCQYAFGVYETSPAPSNNRHVQIADRNAVPFVQDTFWLYFRSDNEGAPRVYSRILGGKELEQGEQRQVSDNTSQAIMDYMGSKNEYDNVPDYTNATGTSITNIHLTDAENLTLGIKRLEHRDDVIPRVRVVDIVSTFLPVGTSATIDGQSLNNDDYVFFTNPAIEGLYKVSGVGTAIAFEKINAFKGIQTPIEGDLIRVESGTNYFKSVWKKSLGYWRPLEISDATKEPTGFPNRTDSEFDFNDATRVFSINPKFPSEYFDIFVKGRPFRFITSQQKQIDVVDDFSGIKFFFFDENGVLDYSNNFDDSIITEKVYVSTLYWDSVNKKAILLGDERHGLTMDAATHEYLHNLNGAVLTDGGTINVDEYEEGTFVPGTKAEVTFDSVDSNSVTVQADLAGLAGNNIQIDPQISSSVVEPFASILAPGEFARLKIDFNNQNSQTGDVVNQINGVVVNFSIGTAGVPAGKDAQIWYQAYDPQNLINTFEIVVRTDSNLPFVSIKDIFDAIIATDPSSVPSNIDVQLHPYDGLISSYELSDPSISYITSPIIIYSETFSGGNALTIAEAINVWNIANPTNTASLTSGNGSELFSSVQTLIDGTDDQIVLPNPNSGMVVSLSDMVLRDEDIVIDIKNSATPSEYFEQRLDPIAYIPVYYQEGQSGNWRKDTATQYPAKQNPVTTRIQYNRIDTWAVEDVQDGYFVSMWIYATNNIEEPVIAILGQAQYSSLSEAQETDQPNILSLNGFPTQEFKILYRCIFESSSSYTNVLNAAIVDTRDLRAVEDTFFAQVSPNDHGLLSGLNDPDHGPNAVNTDGVLKDGGLSEADVTVGESLDTLNKLLGQLRIKEHPTNGNRVIITGANRILNSGTTLIQEIKNLVISFEGAEVDFVSGRIFKEDGITDLGVDFTPEVIPTSEYQNYSITLIPSVVNADNTISAQLIVLPASETSAVKEDAPKAPFAQGTKLGQVTVRESSGGIVPITEADIMQLGTGGGGSGGTGDANELLERLKNRLANYGAYEYMTPVIFSSVEDDLEDPASTAKYSVVNSNYDFELTGDNFTSVQLLDEEFLSEGIELNEIELVHYWNLDGLDENATYEVSRDGGNEWQTVSMSRIGNSDTYRGTHLFTEELDNSLNLEIFAPNLDILTDSNEISKDFNLLKTIILKEISIEGIETRGNPDGYIYAEIIKDDGLGNPSTNPTDVIGKSKFLYIPNLPEAGESVTFDIRATIPSTTTYHVVFKTDNVYKASYNPTISGDNIRIQGSDILLKGLELDLRARITSGTDEVVSEGFGVFYKDDNKVSPVDGNVLRNVSTFVGDVDNLDTFTLDFLPDARLLHVYELGTGQVYRYGAFVLQGYDVVFEPNTFNKPETVSLEFLQIQGGSFDNNDRNGSLLAANHLGSTDANIDLSVAGRGIFLRTPNGTLREITIDDNDNIVIYSV